jgi:hypothetical protein
MLGIDIDFSDLSLSDIKEAVSDTIKGAGVGSSIGGTVGSVIGTAIGGPVGTYAGAVIGAKVGGVIGGVVGGGVSVSDDISISKSQSNNGKISFPVGSLPKSIPPSEDIDYSLGALALSQFIHSIKNSNSVAITADLATRILIEKYYYKPKGLKTPILNELANAKHRGASIRLAVDKNWIFNKKIELGF